MEVKDGRGRARARWQAGRVGLVPLCGLKAVSCGGAAGEPTGGRDGILLLHYRMFLTFMSGQEYTPLFSAVPLLFLPPRLMFTP